MFYESIQVAQGSKRLTINNLSVSDRLYIMLTDRNKLSEAW